MSPEPVRDDAPPRSTRPRLKDKVAIVTGGGSGIGRASALLFAAEGADVCVADLNEAGASRVSNEIVDLGRKALPFPIDVRDRGACAEMTQACESALGPVDVLVSCAGIWSARPPHADDFLIDVSGDDVQTVLDVNLFGTLFANQAVATSMRDAGRKGSIVNLASVSAKFPRASRGPYAISKASVYMLTKIMAVELASAGIRVNALAPGYIQTPMTAAFPERAEDHAVMTQDWLLQQVPLRRGGTAAEVAEAALFLASDDASYFTGGMLEPNGGWYIG